MKNICAVVLVFVICFSMTNIFVSAQEAIYIDEITDLKEAVSNALSFGDTMRKYFPNVAIWIEEYNNYNPIDLPYYSDTQINVDGATYLLLYDNLLPGESYQTFVDYANEIFTESVAVKATTQSYLDNTRPLFYTSDNNIYIASPETVVTYYSFDEYTPETLEVIELNDSYAIGRICLYATYLDEDTSEYEIFHQYPAWVECKFKKTDNGWIIDESALSDMITSTSFDRTYCPENNLYAPSTDDPAFNLVILLPAISLVCIVSVACLSRRRKRATI